MTFFIGTLIAALIGAMLAPSFSHFLNKEKSKLEERLQRLEEAYLLANNINFYMRQLLNNLIFCIAALKNQIKFENIPKTQEEPYSKLYVLFDFHLNAPNSLTEKIDEIRWPKRQS